MRLESVIDSGCAGVMHCKIRLVFFLSILEYSIVGNFIDYSEVKDRHLRSIGIIPKLAVGQKLLFATPEFMRSCWVFFFCDSLPSTCCKLQHVDFLLGNDPSSSNKLPVYWSAESFCFPLILVGLMTPEDLRKVGLLDPTKMTGHRVTRNPCKMLGIQGFYSVHYVCFSKWF